MQLDLFAEPPPPSPLRWDEADADADGEAYDELVKLNKKGFEYILYDMRIGSHWYRVMIASGLTWKPEPHLAVASYAEPLEVCLPTRMTLKASYAFPLDWTPAQVARAIKEGAEPTWTLANWTKYIKAGFAEAKA